MGHQELGAKILDKALAHFGEGIKVIREPKMEGRKMSVILAKGKVENKKSKDSEEKIDAKSENE